MYLFVQSGRRLLDPRMAQTAARPVPADLAVPGLPGCVCRQGADEPRHTWLPDAHVEAPTGGCHRAGGNRPEAGCLRFPAVLSRCRVLPDASHELSSLVIALSLIAVVYIGFVALRSGRHEEAGRLFLDCAHRLRHTRLLHVQRHGYWKARWFADRSPTVSFPARCSSVSVLVF